MEESLNGNNTDNTICVRQIFEKITRLADSTVTEGTDGRSNVEAACRDNEGAVQEHLISSVVFRLNEAEDVWEVENVWDTVHISQLEWHPVNYNGQNDIQAAMAENMNIVLLRSIRDWSRPDGDVWSRQIVWSGSFADSRRILQLLNESSNTSNLIQFIDESFDLHPHLRRQYIARHGSHPLAAAIAAVDSSPTAELLGGGDGEGDGLLCAICHETLSIGEYAKQLPCHHVFHRHCVFSWFYFSLHCRLCRDEYH